MRCKYNEIKVILEKYGADWSNLVIDDIYLKYKDLRNIVLPMDTEFFRKIKDNNLFDCQLPSMDYSNYNFDEVNLNGL